MLIAVSTATPSEQPIEAQTRAMAHQKSKRKNGYTITELMIAGTLGVGLVIVAGQAMVTHLKSNARSESLLRQREDWKRTTRFIESEIAMSERIFTNSQAISIPTGCDLQSSEIKLALDLPRDLPLVLYGIRSVNNLSTEERSQWIGDGQDGQNYGLLIRCGPDLKLTINGEDDYRNSIKQSVILDGIDTSSVDNGLKVTVHDSKSASYSLALKSLKNSRFIDNETHYSLNLGSGSYSRINPITSFPEESSICQRLCGIDPDTGERGCKDVGSYYVVPADKSTFSVPYEGLTPNDNITVCSLIPSINITGGYRSDVIDGLMPSPSSSPGVTIDGGDGTNVLFGTPGPDTLTAGSGDDVIVGRAGSDTIIGGKGNNSYSPWPSLNDPSIGNLADLQTTTITGGDDLDVVYLRGDKTEFSGISSCTKLGGCTIQPSDTSIKLSLVLKPGIEVLVFKDARIDLP